MRTPTSIAIAFLSVLFFATDLLAQEKEDAPKPENPAVLRRFFDKPIDYWGRGLGFEEEISQSGKGREGKPAPISKPSEWGQVVKQPDGTLSYQELPRPLTQVLDHPTPENIRAYFEWRLARTTKILRAAELMKEYRTSTLAAPIEKDLSVPPTPADRPKPPGEGGLAETGPAVPGEAAARKSTFKLIYFHKKNCPHCDTQDLILAEWLKNKPEASLEVIEFGMKPELWRSFQVRGTPSLVLEDPGTKKSLFLEGLSPASLLDRTLGECRAGKVPEATVKGEGLK